MYLSLRTRVPLHRRKVSSALQVVMAVKLRWAAATRRAAHALGTRCWSWWLRNGRWRCIRGARVCVAGAASHGDSVDNAVVGVHRVRHRWYSRLSPQSKRAAVAVAAR